jgi:hypothetical protein
METTAPSGLVDIDATAFADAFAHKSVAVRHSLADHPLYVERVLAVIPAKAAVVRSLTKLPRKLRA